MTESAPCIPAAAMVQFEIIYSSFLERTEAKELQAARPRNMFHRIRFDVLFASQKRVPFNLSGKRSETNGV
ncbi:MAG: hypothetical protein HFF18_02280 [Oscillospiraceae bacterium]|nr:hypothetical protein [Oscillospiraceae bacterium]